MCMLEGVFQVLKSPFLYDLWAIFSQKSHMEIASGVSLGSSPSVCGGYFVEKTLMHVGFF